MLGLALVCLLLVPGPARALRAETEPAERAGGTSAALGYEELGHVTAPELVCRVGDRWVPLAMVELEVDLDVTGILAHGVVTQSFRNPFDYVIEAMYVFPLPENAAVHEMEMRIGERRVRSVVEEREEARRVYQEARSEGRKASLVEQERPNLFTTSVANINPDEVVEVRLEYVHEVSRDGDTFSVVFPLTFTPRYVPGTVGFGVDPAGMLHPVSTNVPQADRITPPMVAPESSSAPSAAIELALDPGVDVLDVRCPSHPVAVEQTDGRWRVGPHARTVTADRDFRVEWVLDSEEGPHGAAFVSEFEGESYGLVMLVPPQRESGYANAFAPRPTETLFVIDVSGSMAGASIREAREALVLALERLGPGDRFNLLRFNDRSSVYASAFRPVDRVEIEEASNWVRGLEAEGGTEIHAALVRALDFCASQPSNTAKHLRRIIFLTDGAVGNEDQVLQTLERRRGAVRVHALGIGFAPNRYLMREMARAGRGLCEFVATGDDRENRIDRFLVRVSHPLWTDLDLRWSGVEVTDVLPSVLPDLHLGEPIFVSARVERVDPGATVALWRLGDAAGPLLELPVSRPEMPQPGIGLRWGRARVDMLMDRYRSSPEDRVRADVVAVGTQFGLVTQFTSRVAIEEVRTADAQGVPRWVASALPEGSQMMAQLPQGGTSRPLWRALGLVLVTLGAGGLLVARQTWR